MSWLNPKHLLNTYGVIGIFLVLFAETGILIGIVLPGDSLLFTAGLLASTHKAGDVHLNISLKGSCYFVGFLVYFLHDWVAVGDFALRARPALHAAGRHGVGNA